MNKSCPMCGTEVDVSIKLCPKCGTALIPDWELGVRKEIKYGAAGCGGCLTLILGLITFIVLIRAVPNILAFIIASIAAIIPCIFYVIAILWLDRYEKEPPYLLIFAFIWGSLVSILFAVIGNEIFKVVAVGVFGQNAGVFLSGSLGAPVIEETAKGIALLILFVFMRHEFDNVTDGIIYGSLVGIGFAMTENILYYGQMLIAGGGLLGLGGLFIGRSILFGFGHAMFTGTTGAGLGFARQTKQGLPVKIIVPIVAYFLAIVEHSVWNSASALLSTQNFLLNVFIIWPLQAVFLALPVFIALLAISYFSLKHEREVIKEELKEELTNATLLSEEYEILTRGGRFKKEWEILWQKGIPAWYYLRKLYQLEIDLAFRKWHTSRGEKLKGILRKYSEPAIKAQILSVREKLV